MTGQVMTETGRASIEGFNRLSDADARRLLESCLAVPRWIDAVAAGRPYDDLGAVLDAAEKAAASLSDDEVDAALARHPRIGERAGSGHDAALSSREQAGVDPKDTAARDELARGNREYEARFGRVFLIRAAGRSSAEILAELRRRLQNGPDEEAAEVAGQLREIALLRLRQLLEAGPGEAA
jgi:2-oxo-4-hydroxy-4-carboxy-5-ureidoimidazoline decarboxylase